MPPTVHELIGRILGPPPSDPHAATPSAPAAPRESLSVLIGRIIDPEWARPGPRLVVEPARPPAGEEPLPELPAV